MEVERDRRAGAPQGTVVLRVEARDAEFLPLDNATVTVTVTAPDGETYDLEAEPEPERAGSYTITFASREAGAYRAKASVTAADGSPAGEREIGWTAEPAAEEFRRLAPDREWLEAIARETGGEVIEPEALADFVAGLPARHVPITESWAYPFWHQPLVFIFAILCLVAEWGLRRLRGLP
ncbi:MAG: hypothetical protein GF346_02020 [Candidatus Eisenbacteria bacterium]|nr:hypothetical protein [Candidatus Eisenbacteria bacterium]